MSRPRREPVVTDGPSRRPDAVGEPGRVAVYSRRHGRRRRGAPRSHPRAGSSTRSASTRPGGSPRGRRRRSCGTVAPRPRTRHPAGRSTGPSRRPRQSPRRAGIHRPTTCAGPGDGSRDASPAASSTSSATPRPSRSAYPRGMAGSPTDPVHRYPRTPAPHAQADPPHPMDHLRLRLRLDGLVSRSAVHRPPPRTGTQRDGRHAVTRSRWSATDPGGVIAFVACLAVAVVAYRCRFRAPYLPGSEASSRAGYVFAGIICFSACSPWPPSGWPWSSWRRLFVVAPTDPNRPRPLPGEHVVDRWRTVSSRWPERPWSSCVPGRDSNPHTLSDSGF